MNYNQQNPMMMYGPQGGMVYNQNYRTPLMTNALTDEEIKKLRKAANQAAIPQVTTLELAKAKCTHRDPQKNSFATIENGDGTLTCTICGKRFKPVTYSKEQVEELVTDMIDVLQTTKMNYIDMPAQAAAEYFKMIPLLERAPELYQQSVNSFAKYDQDNMFTNQSNGNFFQMLGMLTSPQMGAYNPQMQYQYQYQQPMMQQQQQFDPYSGQPMQQPMMQQQPMMAPGQSAFYAQPQPQQANMLAPNQPVQPTQQPQQQPQVGKAEVKNILNA